MTGIPITLVGKSFTDAAGNTTFVGEAFSPGLHVGGGPMPGGPPLGFWGGSLGPYPDAGLPGPQPKPPLGFWGGSLGDYIDAGFPAPQPPFSPPGGGAGEWRWVYSQRYGWVLDPGAGGKPQPPGGAGSQPGDPPHPAHLPAEPVDQPAAAE